MTREVLFGSRRIRYELQRARRGTLAIAVHADGRVVVRAPVGLSAVAADARVARRGAWILRQLRRRPSALEAVERRYASGATVRLLGRDLMIRVRRSRECTVRLDRPYLRVFSPDTSEKDVEALVRHWMRERFRKRLAGTLEQLAPRVLGRSATPPAWRLVSMKRRWGSCSRRGTISLHPQLMEQPAGCIEYVVLHELCHLKHLGHGRAFRASLTRLLPEWKRWKRRLDGV